MSFDVDAWREELLAHRERKDEQFAEARASPLPPAEREGFEGLDYFEPDPDYRVQATVDLVDDRETVPMETTVEGGEQLYERAAWLRFELEDADGEVGEHSLVAYRPVGRDDASLFVPFRDKTTGQQTYGGGRYMELHPEEGALEDGAAIPLDFNLAYTPFCAFSDVYECPLPPEENWLQVAIPAGERFER